MERTKQADRACARCRYCGSVAISDKTLQLVCRKEPPKTSAALIMAKNSPQWMGTTSWPNVTATDWCGAFEPEVH